MSSSASVERATPARTLRVGLLGFGTVGHGTYRMLLDNAASLTRKSGVTFEVTRVGIRDASKERPAESSLFTTDLHSIVSDPNIDVIVEVIGGLDPATELVETALRNGKSVVTANKEMIAKHGNRLLSLAQSLGLDLHYEAAVGGGIPVVQALKHQLAGNDVLQLRGILNGTTNVILTRMSQSGASFEDALAEAQAAGYAEADPTNDVDGFDTLYKTSILASIAFGGSVDLSQTHREGIRNISPREFHFAQILGYKVKLLGIAEEAGPNQVRIRVHPTLIPLKQPIAAVDDVYNALHLRGDFVGDLMFSGRGAGSDPTASAVVGDLLDVGRTMATHGTGSALSFGPQPLQLANMDGLVSRYYIRMIVEDKPNTLGRISTVFGDHSVGLAEMEMRVLEDGEQGEIVFLTHRSTERQFRDALAAVSNLPVVHQVAAWLRVES